MLKRFLAMMLFPITELVDYVRFKLRVRAMKRKDPFIY
jgi:hypothetical protein